MAGTAALLVCFVIGVSDGDTLTARFDMPRGTAIINVRLAEVDAPEKGQPWGGRSRQHLRVLCLKKPAELASASIDPYGRTGARVSCAGVDANDEQVRAGMAWVFDRYASDLRLFVTQSDARSARVGLWSDSRPIAPWQWRAGRRR